MRLEPGMRSALCVAGLLTFIFACGPARTADDQAQQSANAALGGGASSGEGEAHATPSPNPEPTESPAPSPGPTASPTPSPAPTPSPMPSLSPVPKSPEPNRVTVQHVLIAFAGKIPGKTITRSQEEAQILARQLLERAKKGEDFDALVKEFTDDQAPGIYALFNRGQRPMARDEYPRQGMVGCFGDLSFSLAVGQIGMCDFDPTLSPYGWHIIKRIK